MTTSYDDEKSVSALSLKDYLQAIYQGKWIILLSFIVVFGLAYYVASQKDIYYQASTTILVHSKAAQQKPMIEFEASGEQRSVRDEVEILKSRAMADSVALQLLRRVTVTLGGKDTMLFVKWLFPGDGPVVEGLASHETVIRRLQRSLSVNSVRDADIVTITIVGKNAHETAIVANAYAEVYCERNLSSNRNESRRVREFLEGQLAEKDSVLKRAETGELAYQEQQGIVSLSEEAKSIIDQLSGFEAKREDVRIQLRATENLLGSYKQKLAEQQPQLVENIANITADSYIKYLQEEIAKREVARDVTIASRPTVGDQQLFESTIRASDENIRILKEKRKEKIEELIKTNLTTGDPLGYARGLIEKIYMAQIEIQSLQAKVNALGEVIKQYNVDFEKLPRKGIELARLERKRQSCQKLYTMLEEEYQRARVAEESQFGNAEIVDRAIPQISPIGISKSLLLIMAALGGFSIGLGYVLLRRYLDRTVRTFDDIEQRAGLSVLAAIPTITVDDELGKIRMDDNVRAKLQRIKAQMITHLEPLSIVSESYKVLRTNIQFAGLDKPIKTILVTSSIAGEGKTTVASNLAITMAQAGNRTLIVGADLRRPTLHLVYGVRREPGITNYLAGMASLEQTVQKSGIDRLAVITCGAVPPNPSELLSSQKLKDFIALLKDKVDVILFDSPPLVPVIDAAIISAYADGVVLVASSGLSKIDLLKHAKEILDRVDAKLLGVAFNNYHMAKGYFGEPYHYEYQPSEAPVRDNMESPAGRRRTGNRVRIMKVNK
jgi:capsular exopolysaccharide synthesis family protein